MEQYSNDFSKIDYNNIVLSYIGKNIKPRFILGETTYPISCEIDNCIAPFGIDNAYGKMYMKVSIYDNGKLIHFLKNIDDTISKQQSSDVKQIAKDIESNTSLKTALSRINSYDEFEALVLGMAALVNPNFAKQKQDIKSALSSLSNKIKAMNEESETPTDTQGVYKIINTLKLLKTHLENVNSRQEFEELIFALLPHIDPTGAITKDKNKLANAIVSASNRNSLRDTRPIDLDQLGR